MDFEQFWIKMQDDISNALQAAYNQGYEDGLKHGRVVRPRKVKPIIRVTKPLDISEETMRALKMLGRQSHKEG